MKRYETPNAVMHTYASRELTGTELAVWKVEMEPGAAGPLHRVDADQVMVLIEGELEVAVGEAAPRRLSGGESIVLPAGAERQVTSAGKTAAVAIVSARAGARASTADREPAVIPWAS